LTGQKKINPRKKNPAGGRTTTAADFITTARLRESMTPFQQAYALVRKNLQSEIGKLRRQHQRAIWDNEPDYELLELLERNLSPILTQGMPDEPDEAMQHQKDEMGDFPLDGAVMHGNLMSTAQGGGNRPSPPRQLDFSKPENPFPKNTMKTASFDSLPFADAWSLLKSLKEADRVMNRDNNRHAEHMRRIRQIGQLSQLVPYHDQDIEIVDDNVADAIAASGFFNPEMSRQDAFYEETVQDALRQLQGEVGAHHSLTQQLQELGEKHKARAKAIGNIRHIGSGERQRSSGADHMNNQYPAEEHPMYGLVPEYPDEPSGPMAEMDDPMEEDGNEFSMPTPPLDAKQMRAQILADMFGTQTMDTSDAKLRDIRDQDLSTRRGMSQPMIQAYREMARRQGF